MKSNGILQVILFSPGETFSLDVCFIDEHGKGHHVPLFVEVMEQASPRLLGIKVAGKPVLLRSSDIVFHSANPKEEAIHG